MLFSDPAQFQTDLTLQELEKEVHDVYVQAWKELEEKAMERLASFEAALEATQLQLAAEEITQAEYQAWLFRQTAMNKNLTDLVDVLAADLHNANLIAARIANGAMAEVYALNANYAMFEIYQQLQATGQIPKAGLSFTLYNKKTVEALLKKRWSISADRGKNALLPKPSPQKKRELLKLRKTNPDELWNAEKLKSALTQGILQGEGPSEIANRFLNVAKMDENQAIRNARTMTTNVQNMGRQQAYTDAANMGIELTIEWYATLDGVTRHSHRLMHGDRKPNKEDAKFKNGLRWPGDPEGPPGEVYNCRCTTVSWVKGYEHNAPRNSTWLKKQQQAFDEWQNGGK